MNKKHISTIVENEIKINTKAHVSKNNSSLSPIVKLLKGSFKAPENFDYKKELAERFAKLYSRK